MPTYAIGDVQGCYDTLQDLLHSIAFDSQKDTLWFTGDLVNRGAQSLQVLRFIYRLPNVQVVLGNHDIYLLSLANGHPFQDHTMQELLSAPDCKELVDWLRYRPLLHYDAELGYVMAHAGIFPFWSLAQAQACAQEVERILQRADYADFLDVLYGNLPDCWQANLASYDRLRFIMNAFTRMRFCSLEGQLDFGYKGRVGSQPAHLLPWFAVPHRAIGDIPIVFGHWAALEGKVQTGVPVFALDTGCAWGAHLTAMRLEDRQLFSVPARNFIKTT